MVGDTKKERRKKIIQILHHSDSPFHQYWKFNLFADDWHVRVAEQILKQTNEYEVECWRPERKLKCPVSGERDGIIFRAFPSFYLWFGREYSRSLINELKKQSREYNILIHLHGVHNHLTYLISWLFKNKPIIAQHHGELPPLPTLRRSDSPLRFFCLLECYAEKKTLKNIDYFFALTREEKEFLCSMVGDKRVKIQTMGVDFDMFKPMDKKRSRIKFNLEIEKGYILYVGHLNEQKGLYYLFKAFPEILKNYPNTVLLLAGEGKYRGKLEAIAKDIEIRHNVIFLGYINKEQLPFLYNAVDVFVLPSLGEGVPLACIEAMACGTPTIATNVGGIPDIINNFEGGLVIPPKNHKAISDAVLAIFEDQNLAKANRENGEKYYSWKSIIKNTVDVYNNLFGGYYGGR